MLCYFCLPDWSPSPQELGVIVNALTLWLFPMAFYLTIHNISFKLFFFFLVSALIHKQNNELNQQICSLIIQILHSAYVGLPCHLITEWWWCKYFIRNAIFFTFNLYRDKWIWRNKRFIDKIICKTYCMCILHIQLNTMKEKKPQNI